MYKNEAHILLIGAPKDVLESVLSTKVKLSIIIYPGALVKKSLLQRVYKVIYCDINNVTLCLFHAQCLHNNEKLTGVVTFT